MTGYLIATGIGFALGVWATFAALTHILHGATHR